MPGYANLESFHLFSQLPLDIRLEIWTWTLPRPRFINSQYQPLQARAEFPAFPAISINNESRSLALTYFSLTEIGVFVDFAHDYFHLPVKSEGTERWETHPQTANAVFKFYNFENARKEFPGTFEHYLGVLPGLKEVVLQIHVVGMNIAPRTPEENRKVMLELRVWAAELVIENGRRGVVVNVGDCGLCEGCRRMRRRWLDGAAPMMEEVFSSLRPWFGSTGGR
jgi:hypothetical protein